MIEVRHKIDLSVKLGRHKDWKHVFPIIQTLQKNGFTTLLAGGCVRDLLMGRAFSDIDVASSAKPEDIEKLFPNALGIGREFGVMMIPFEGGRVEVATFREDLEYEDGRRPEGVKFTDPKSDARRRDFTVNALFYDVQKNLVIDFVGGMKDLPDMILKVVGDPVTRFEEDKLRLLRCVRFASQLGFEIEPKTFSAVQQLAPQIKAVAQERIQVELTKFAIGKYAHLACEAFGQSGLWESLISEPSLTRREKDWDLLARTFDREQSQNVREDLRLSILFLPQKIDEASLFQIDQAMKRLKFSNQKIKNVQWILKTVGELSNSKIRLGQVLSWMNKTEMMDAIDLWVALDDSKDSARGKIAEGWMKNGIPAKSYLSGDDLKKAGIPPSAEMGKILEEVYWQQLEGKISSKEEALKVAKTLKF